MLLSAHPYFQHYYIYPLIIGFAALMTSDSERDAFVTVTRNALLIFFTVGYLFLLVKPNLAADFSYSQGLIPGLPRFAGLAPHSIVLAGLTQIAMLTLMLQPFTDRRHNILAWLICGVTMVFAQSKTVWLSTIVIGLILYVARNKDRLKAQLWEERYKGAFIAALVFAMVSVTAISANLLFGNISNKLDRFLSSQEGAQITSMTGRDQIWELAIARWLGNPIFGDGAGPSLGLSAATHAHNQLLDTLMHAGLVGGTGLLIYFLTLGYYSIKYSAESRGVTLAIFLVIAFRCVGEIPLSVKGYGLEFIAQLLLLVLIASYASRRSNTRPNPNPQLISPRHQCLRSR
jgi:O-antigen ligase